MHLRNKFLFSIYTYNLHILKLIKINLLAYKVEFNKYFFLFYSLKFKFLLLFRNKIKNNNVQNTARGQSRLEKST